MNRKPLLAAAAAGAFVFALAGPALPAQATVNGSATGAACFNPVASGARGGTSPRAGDTRDISAAEQLRIEQTTAKILNGKLVGKLTGLLKGSGANKGKPGGGGTGGGTDPAGAALNNIPVYVHQMLSSSGAGRVTSAQITAQIAEMNQDYAGQDANAHTGT